MAGAAAQTGQRLGGGKTPARAACAALLAVYGILALDALHQHNVTVDEGGHLLSGILAWEEGRLDVYRVNPPLVKGLVSLPVVASRPELPEAVAKNVSRDWSAQHVEFMKANRERYQELLVRARCVLVGLSVLAGFLVYRWGSDLFGAAAGLTGLALWAVCPNVLAWAGVCTVDLGAAVFGLAAMYSLRSYLRRPEWLTALGAGTMLGLAALAKFTLLVLYPVWLILWLVPWPARSTRWLHFLLVLLVSGLVINAGYGFEGTGRRLEEFPFRCHALTNSAGGLRLNRFAGTWLGRLPVPLPESFVSGLDEQKSYEDIGAPAYLRGEWSETGWWYYYLYVLAVKVPLGTWALAGLALLLACASPRYRAPLREEMLLWLPAAGIVALVSSQTGLDGYGSPRYLLPAFPFLFIGISRVGLVLEDAWGWLRGAQMPGRLRAAGCALLVLAALAWNAASVLRVHPHHLSYFNELAGGPDQGWKHLIESNIDWGQDLLFLKQWSDEHPEARPLRLAPYAGMQPHLAGLNCWPVPYGPYAGSGSADPLQQGPQPGWYAVSVNLVCGMGWTEYDLFGRRTSHPRHAYDYFQLFTPVAKAGYSIFIYHITPEEADRVRSQMGLPPLAP